MVSVGSYGSASRTTLKNFGKVSSASRRPAAAPARTSPAEDIAPRNSARIGPPSVTESTPATSTPNAPSVVGISSRACVGVAAASRGSFHRSATRTWTNTSASGGR